VQRTLPFCLIHTIADEMLAKTDLAYYVIDTWVDRLEDVPMEVTIDIHEPCSCIDPLTTCCCCRWTLAPECPTPATTRST
jgi:hypothetical protein